MSSKHLSFLQYGIVLSAFSFLRIFLHIINDFILFSYIIINNILNTECTRIEHYYQDSLISTLAQFNERDT